MKQQKIPKPYLSKLSKKNTKEQKKEILKSRRLYKKGQFYQRKKMHSFVSRKSKHILDFEKKYNIKITNLYEVSKKTKVPIAALQKIINKGMGAYYSSGSRPNQTPHSWGYARLASVLLKRNAYKIDKHILDKYGVDIK